MVWFDCFPIEMEINKMARVSMGGNVKNGLQKISWVGFEFYSGNAIKLRTIIGFGWL